MDSISCHWCRIPCCVIPFSGSVLLSKKSAAIAHGYTRIDWIDMGSGRKANDANLRAHCWFKLAELVNGRLVDVQCADADTQEQITEELDGIKEINDGKDMPRRIIRKGGVGKEDENKETMKNLLGRSPDYGDGLMMRMYCEVVQVPEPSIRWL